ncbi:MAG: hypothetical protein L0H93_19830 [Nocardioides sp.]|nr:hypothetical protein [Nocardioides sp.]
MAEMAAADRDLDSGETLTAVEDAVAARRAAEVVILHQAARWADLHGDHEGVTLRHGSTDPQGERREHPEFRQFGGEGTPVVHEFATAELGVSLRVHPLGARSWMADALDLRHRLTVLWELTFADAPFEVWVLRKIAAKTRHLGEEAAGLVAGDLAPLVASLPPGRLLERLDALVILADAAADEDARQQGLDRRFARINSSDTRGLKGLYAKLAAADAVVGDAQIQRVAEVLLARDKAAGTPPTELDSIAVARSRALGVLIADPATALDLINGVDGGDEDHGDAGAEHGTTSRPPTLSTRVGAVVHLHLSHDALQMLARHRTTSQTSDHGGNTGAVAGVGRLEAHGPVNLHEALEILGLTDVTIRPAIDPSATAPADTYAFTGTLREAVLTRTPADIYPFATCTTHHMDIDHTVAHEGRDADHPEGGDPGQTRIENGGPMTRHHHRIKTHGPMAVRQPLPDIYVWQSPHHRYRLTDSTGTHDLDPMLGSGFFSDDPVDRALSTLRLRADLGLLAA